MNLILVYLSFYYTLRNRFIVETIKLNIFLYDEYTTRCIIYNVQFIVYSNSVSDNTVRIFIFFFEEVVAKLRASTWINTRFFLPLRKYIPHDDELYNIASGYFY